MDIFKPLEPKMSLNKDKDIIFTDEFLNNWRPLNAYYLIDSGYWIPSMNSKLVSEYK